MSKRYSSHASKSARDKQFPFSGPVLQQNAGRGAVFVFGGSSVLEVEDDEMENAMEMSQVHKRMPNGFRRVYRDEEQEDDPYVYVERELCEGDSLQSLCLHYGCPVAELKRVNGLYNDQDFFARRTIRIPVRRNGLLTETDELAKRAPKPGSLPLLYNSTTKRTDILVNGLEDVRVSDSDEEILFSHEVAVSPLTSNNVRPFLQRMDKELAAVKEKIDGQALPPSEEDRNAAALARIAPNPTPTDTIHTVHTKAESEVERSVICGCSWRTIAMAGLVLFATLPLTYYFLFLHKSNKQNETNPP